MLPQNFVFIDSTIYSTAINRNLSLIDLATSIQNRIQPILLSETTFNYLLNLNDTLNSTLLNGDVIYSGISDDTKYQLTLKPIGNIEKYYDFVSLPGNITLVVIYPGFLFHLVESKGNYLQFLLKCLYLLYNLRNMNIGNILRRYLTFNRKDTDIRYLKLNFFFLE